MTKHQKIDVLPNLDRRSFLVGTAATGLVFGYVGAPAISDALAATAANFEPTIWYAIGHDGKVNVTVGKADMGQHIASTMAQLVAEELESSWKDMTITLASNDPKYNDPILGAAGYRRQLEHRNELRHDVPRRRRRPDHAHQGGRRDARRAGRRMLRARIARASCEVEEERDLRADRRRAERPTRPGRRTSSRRSS